MREAPRNDEVEEPDLHQIPGKAIYLGDNKAATTMEIIDYDSSKFESKVSTNLKDAYPYKESGTVSWINITGFKDIEKIKSLGEYFGLHSLSIEDIVNTEQRPKIEEFDNGILLIMKVLYYDKNDILTKEHIGIFLGKDYVITFKDYDIKVFDKLKERIQYAKGRVRAASADYLMYVILDVIIDDYFIVIDNIIDKAEMLEDELFKKKTFQNITEEIQELKREIMKIRKAIQPTREITRLLENTQHAFIKKKTRNYLRDLKDNILQVSENLDIYREIVWSLMELYMTTINNKMNEVMKVLTIMASIFIPLTFIAGVYGMNFENMPELKFQYGYYYILGVMLLIILAMLVYFKRRRWL